MRRLLVLLVLLAAALPAASEAGRGNVTNGDHLYGQYCLACHGPGGEGVLHRSEPGVGFGPLRAQAQQKGIGPPLRGVGALAADFYLTTGYMPLHHVGQQPRRSRVLLDDQSIADITAYIASLGEGPPIPKPDPARGNLSEGQQLFTDHCAGCHQVVAEGGYIPDAVAPPLQDATDVQIAEAVRIGPYVMPRFPESAISNSELDSIIRYVDYAKHPDDRGGWALGHVGPVPEGLVTWFIAGTVLVVLCIVIGTRLRDE